MPSATGFSRRNIAVNKEAAAIRSMFNAIAWRYDLANHLLSFGMDLIWRKRLVRILSKNHVGSPPQVLDICCGTGDMGLEVSGLGTVFGVDFAHTMLLRAQQKSRNRSTVHPLYWIESDALGLPFTSATFDLVSVAFGIRNFADLDAGIRELARVLRPGGILAVVEFSMPRIPIFSFLYRFYFQTMLPLVGGWITGNPSAYRYLPASVHLFSRPSEICTVMRKYQLAPILVETWTGGIVAGYLSRKKG